MSKIHLLTYAQGNALNDGYEYAKTQKLLTDSIQNFTKREVIFHTHNLDTIRVKDWFKHIKDFPSIPDPHLWSRGGYWCSWKAFLTLEVFNQMSVGDVLYYIDSSRWQREGILDNIDKLIDYVVEKESIFGSIGNDNNQLTGDACSNTKLWELIWPESKTILPTLLNTQHILTTWYILRKDSITQKILNEWVNLFIGNNIDGVPIFTLHQTPEQSLWNILVYREKGKVFSINREDYTHSLAKNFNIPHWTINQGSLPVSSYIYEANLDLT